MQCDDFREIADSYLGDELLIETNHDVIRHLDSCHECRLDLAARRQLRHQLRTQFNESGDLRPSDQFADDLRNHLRAQAPGRPRNAMPKLAYVGIAAMLLIGFGLGFIALQNWRVNQRDLTAWTNLTESAAGDHRECALEHKLGPTIIDLAEAGRTYDRAFTNLANEIVAAGVLPSNAQLIDAHSCAFGGRRFAHLVLKYRDQVVSVLVAKTEGPNRNAPKPGSGDLVADLNSRPYRIAYVGTERHAIFVVSGLDRNENMEIAKDVVPALEKHIRRAEQNLEARAFKLAKRGY